MAFKREDRIREAAVEDVGWFFRKAAEKDWHGIAPAFIDWGRLDYCDGFLVAEHDGEVVGAVATSSKGMDGSSLPTIANLYVLREYGHKGVGCRLLVEAIRHLLDSGCPRVFCKATTNAMVKTIDRLPSDLKNRLEFAVDLSEDMVELWELKESIERGQ